MKAEDQSAERVAFEKWAHDHLGQGYSMEREDHTYIDPVTRWAHKAWQARAALSAREAPAREGWQWVPKEPGACYGDDSGWLLALMAELHSNVPEDQRPNSWSDFSDEQRARIMRGWRAALAASPQAPITDAALSKQGGNHG